MRSTVQYEYLLFGGHKDNEKHKVGYRIHHGCGIVLGDWFYVYEGMYSPDGMPMLRGRTASQIVKRYAKGLPV